MKKVVHFLLTVAVLLGLGWTLWIGLRKQHAREPVEAVAEGTKPPDSEAARELEKPEDFVVKLEKEKWQALALEKAEPEKAELKPQRIAFGRVLDPTPLVALDGELAAAEAALKASRAENERTQKLLAAGENTSRKSAETSEAQFRGDASKAEGLYRRAAMEWGGLFPPNDVAKRQELINRLVSGESALVRVELLPADAFPERPARARLVVLGREGQPFETQMVMPAADVDPKTQAQGFVLRVDQPPFPLRPGMALSAWLEVPEKPLPGFAVPRSAILRHDGRTWVYVQEEEEKFTRKPIVCSTPLEGERGWFVPEAGGGLKADDLLVVVGAQSLLSEELRAQGGAEVD